MMSDVHQSMLEMPGIRTCCSLRCWSRDCWAPPRTTTRSVCSKLTRSLKMRFHLLGKTTSNKTTIAPNIVRALLCIRCQLVYV